MPTRRATALPAELLTLALLAASAAPPAGAAAEFRLGTAFAFQGRLEQRGAPADGTFDFEIELYDRREGGEPLGRRELLDVAVERGRFALALDFGAPFRAAAERWLEVRVREPGRGPYTALAPRQRVEGATTTCTVDSLVVTTSAGIGTTAAPAASALEVKGAESDGTTGAALAIRSGSGLGSQTLWLDGDEIDSVVLGALRVNSNVATDLSLVAGGGKLGIGTIDPATKVHVLGGTDVTVGGGGYLVLGSTSGANLALDNNEIMARDGGAVSTLFLNANGGDVAVGGLLDIGYQIVSAEGCDGSGTVTVSCTGARRVLGGGCFSDYDEQEIETSHPVGTTGWQCRFDDCDPGVFTTGFFAYAICAGVVD
jgi:hypothetical protein